ncbi:MAG TPA: hypothetical protein VH163_07340 [Gemmatimonadales bacterium]|nr:hypothetical protein [Gemmatimonadales bacterium]
MYPNLPGAPAAVHFPPLFPLLLAPLFGIWSPAVAGAIGRVLGIICFALACRSIVRHAVSLRLLGDDLSPWVAEGLVAAVAFAIPVLSILGVLLSEPAFTLTLAVTLVLGDRPAAEWSGGRAWGVGLLAAAALLLRSVGLAALAGLLVVAWRMRLPRRHVLAVAMPSLVAGLGWGLWVMVHQAGIDPAIRPDYGSYLEIVHDAGVRTFVGSLTDLPRPLSVLTLNWVPATWVYYALGIPALVVGGWGICVLTRRSLLGWVLIAYLGMLALWPYPPDRFLWAILPWLALAWAAGALALWRRKSRVLQAGVALLALSLAYGYVRYEVRGLSGHWWDLTAGRISTNMAELLPAIDSLPASAVVATDNEPLVWLYTRRQAVPFYLFAYSGRQLLQPLPELQLSYLRRNGVTHVLLSGLSTGSAEQLDRLLGAYPGVLTITRRWSGGRALFELKRDHP